jgi:hypothetical protein
MRGLGVPSFDAQTRALRIARDVLLALLRDDRPPEEIETELLAREVLPAVRLIDRGIGLTERAERLDPTTTRDLLRHAGLRFGPSTAADRVAADRERAILAQRREDGIDLSAGAALAAANHARVVFAVIPRLPEDLVTWPRPRLGTGYADIAAPSGIGNLVERVDELATVLWRMAAGRRIDPDEHLRRTYAFCETSGWLDLSLVRH